MIAVRLRAQCRIAPPRPLSRTCAESTHTSNQNCEPRLADGLTYSLILSYARNLTVSAKVISNWSCKADNSSLSSTVFSSCHDVAV